MTMMTIVGSVPYDDDDDDNHDDVMYSTAPNNFDIAC